MTKARARTKKLDTSARATLLLIAEAITHVALSLPATPKVRVRKVKP